MREAIFIDRGFDTYQIPGSLVPRLKPLFSTGRIKAPQGGGEPAIIAVGAVVANAIFDATGARFTGCR